MKKCTKCGKDNEWGQMFLCRECEEKKNKKEITSNVVLFVIALLIILAIRVTWAQLVYHDIRCVLAECRISK